MVKLAIFADEILIRLIDFKIVEGGFTNSIDVCFHGKSPLTPNRNPTYNRHTPLYFLYKIRWVDPWFYAPPFFFGFCIIGSIG